MEVKPDYLFHPPVLSRRDLWRILVFLAGFVGVIGLATGGMLGVGMPLLWFFHKILGEEFVGQYGMYIGLIPGLVVIVAAVNVGMRLWIHYFIESGYLSDAAVIRIVLLNRMPPVTLRRWRLFAGVVFLAFSGLGVTALLKTQRGWMLLLVMPFLVWVVTAVRGLWREEDRMFARGQVPPGYDASIRYIERLMEVRRARKLREEA